ncbi:DENN domain-containing protein 5A-like [Ctenocephalides felis]|uniref:DENN domain-containing protein 5A-like n=1 Tax=Ctenocephalides felis TaxID=7515 RepID=UPI000E6E11F1|nr:DENN domain-containing protein 5A-like [Ctenocephalides felis]
METESCAKFSNHDCYNRLVDYFVICGLDIEAGLEPDRYFGDKLHCSPLERSYKSAVLAHYPESVSWNPFDPHAVCMLSLPLGLQFKTQKNCLEPRFHGFLMTKEDGKRCYGFSLVFYEEVRYRNICNAMHTLQAMHLTELSSGQGIVRPKGPHSRSLPRHLKLMSPHSGSALTYYDVAKDKLFVSKSIVILTQECYSYVAEIFLTNLYKSLPRQPGPGLSPEAYIYNLLYDAAPPHPGKSVRLFLPPPNPSGAPLAAVMQKPGLNELPPLHYPLRTLFKLLGVENVVQLFTCLLLENQVLLRSSDCQRLMVVAECITGLLFPFAWPHVYVPVLPASLHHFLDAPVPFVMGLHAEADSILKIGSEAALCFVDIDKPLLQLPEEIPVFPHRNAFIQELQAVLDKHQVVCHQDEVVTNQQTVVQNQFAGGNAKVDVMTASCTLPSGMHLRRKHSLHDVLDWDRPNSPDVENQKPPKHDGKFGPRSEALQRVRRTGDVDCAVLPSSPKGPLPPMEQYCEDMRLNNAIREIFLNRFVQMFAAYEHFVIYPQNTEEQGSPNSSLHSFDKASFLSDQPLLHRQFLSRFLESQMFASLIDHKAQPSSDHPHPSLGVFEHRLNLLKKRYGGDSLSRSPNYEPCTCSRESQRALDRRLASADFEAPPPRELLPNRPAYFRSFPLLDKSVLNQDRTKRMLLEKLGPEAGTLGLSNGGLGGVEESTLVSSLCDLLERIWSHGLQDKKGKSALWVHLTSYQELQKGDDLKSTDPNFLTPGLSWCVLKKRLDYLSTMTIEDASTSTKDSPRDETKNLTEKQLKPLPESLIFDIRNIQAMTDIKTHIGYARAWVRLSLEKKLLSRHLRTLLSQGLLLKTLYRRCAFLRCEDEREQFLYHLLTLNAVDYFCFTNTYPTTTLPYRVIIFPSRKSSAASSTTANCYIVISGTISETQHIPIPKGSLEFVFNHKNLGILTTLRIGHDSTGLSANWKVENVLVRNEVTGHSYKFPCGRWLGRGIDDGSTERLLVGTLVPSTVPSKDLVVACSTPPRSRSPCAAGGSTVLKPSDIQTMISDCVNVLVKWHYKPSRHRDVSTLTTLLCGENGLVKSLQQAFLFGFRSSRLFGRNLYLWDYFVRVKEEFEANLVEDSLAAVRGSATPQNQQEVAAVWRCYCHLVDEIQNASHCHSLGKDGKFQLFICLSLREHLLHRMLQPMAATKLTAEMYEEQSFLRRRGLLTFFRQILEPLDEFHIVLENSITQGIPSHC